MASPLQTTLDTLHRERAGTLFPGLTQAFLELEWLDDRVRKAEILQEIVRRYPRIPPAWKKLSMLLDDPDARMRAILSGLEGDPAPTSPATRRLRCVSWGVGP